MMKEKGTMEEEVNAVWTAAGTAAWTAVWTAARRVGHVTAT